MRLHCRQVRAAWLLALASLALASCSQDAKRDKHLAAGDRYYAAGDYDRAEIEYRNVREIETLNPHAIEQLSNIYFEEGRTSHAIPYLLRSREVLPDNLDLQLKLAQVYQAIGKNSEAETEAWAVLAKRPTDEEAPIVIAAASATLEDAKANRERFSQLPTSAQHGPPIVTALGILTLREGNADAAETAFRNAIALDPNYAPAYSALATILSRRNDVTGAGAAFATAARLSPERSGRRLQSLQFKIEHGGSAEAQRELEALTQKYPDQLPAWILLAQIAASEKQYDRAAGLVDKVLERDDVQPEALLLGAQLKLLRRDADGAVTQLTTAVRVYPHWAQAQYQLGMAYMEKGESDKAYENLVQAVALDPGLNPAILLVAELDLKKGNFSAVIVSMQRLLKARPDLPQGWLLLGDAYQRQANPEAALETYSRMASLYPKFWRPPFQAGLILARQKKLEPARTAFAKALELSPGSLAIIEQLANLDLAEGKFDDAEKWVGVMLQNNPKNAAPYLLRAKIKFAQHDNAGGEVALFKATEVQPDDANAYMMLAGVYLGNHDEDKAMRRLQEAATKAPKNPVPLMMIALLDDQKGNYPAARDAYEKVLELQPKTATALNNLAYLYAEKFNQLEKAYGLAQRAYDIFPQDPHTSDTLGWILYQKKVYGRAFSLLGDAAAKMPEAADVQFHFGMAAYMTGDETTARSALERALQLDPKLSGRDQAADRLAMLNLDVDHAKPSLIPELERRVAEHPDDIIATARLGAAYERTGALGKAEDAFESAVQANPKNSAITLGLIRLYMKQHNSVKAIELGNNARRLMPNDISITRSLGRLAFETGDYQWAASLLQETASKLPHDPAVQFDYAQASYAVGMVSEAREAMQAALSAGLKGPQSATAERFLTLTSLGDANDPSSEQKQLAARAAQETPPDIPALMVLASAAERTGQISPARKIYESVVARYPSFAPALKHLAVICIQNPAETQLAFGYATKARIVLPKDSELARVLGIALYRQGEFERAAVFLSERLLSQPDEAETVFLLGMTQLRLNKTPEGQANLRRALGLGLSPVSTAEAKQALAPTKP